MPVLVELGLDIPARTSCAPSVFVGAIFCVRIASLNDKAGHNSVKDEIVIKPRACKFLKVLHGLGRGIRKELYSDLSKARLNAGS